MNQSHQAPALALGVEEAARVIGVARSMLYEIVGRGEIESFKLGRRRLILVKTLEAYINRVAKENAR
ncbi:helix-turn-helix domain-containing protein [Pseudomonas sp. CLCA07]